MPDNSTAVSISTDALVDFYRSMVLIRKCEERLVKSYYEGLIYGACHTYIGEEAVAVGVCAHLRKDDLIFSTHRGHGHALAKGLDAYELISELYGRSTGCCGGRGGSMHIFKPEVGLMGTIGIVGPGILMATGAAYSFTLTGADRVSVAFFGDGASNNGAFHEGLNLAAIWNLPAVFICENNLYATEVPFESVSGSPDVVSRAVAYGITGEAVDGNDVEAVWEAARRAIERARSGNGPTLLECRTYRVRPHAEGMDDSGYRTKQEINDWKTRCPIDACREALKGRGVDPSTLDEVEQAIRGKIDEAHTRALNDPWPDPESIPLHLYSDTLIPEADLPRFVGNTNGEARG